MTSTATPEIDIIPWFTHELVKFHKFQSQFSCLLMGTRRLPAAARSLAELLEHFEHREHIRFIQICPV